VGIYRRRNEVKNANIPHDDLINQIAKSESAGSPALSCDPSIFNCRSNRLEETARKVEIFIKSTTGNVDAYTKTAEFQRFSDGVWS
jgi:hypothetical protein